jgi:hypothetical protein
MADWSKKNRPASWLASRVVVQALKQEPARFRILSAGGEREWLSANANSDNTIFRF